MAARVAHNHKVAGSSPAPATITSAHLYGGLLLWLNACAGLEAATLQRSQVKNASGILQGSPLLQTGLQRCGDGVAERDLSPAPLP